jgi:hypothetical protein
MSILQETEGFRLLFIGGLEMKFNSEVFCRKNKCFRESWPSDQYLTFDGENFVEHKNGMSMIWYWQTADEFSIAVKDITAEDWGYI